MSKLGPTPGFVCMWKGKRNATLDHPWPSEEALANSHFIENKNPSYNDTAAWVKFWRPYFHFTSIEYRSFGNLHKTNWEYENLVSMIVMKDPLGRFLSAGKCGSFHMLPDPTEDTQDLYWEYANSVCADNYALRGLTNESVSCSFSHLSFSLFTLRIFSSQYLASPTSRHFSCSTFSTVYMERIHLSHASRVQRSC